MFWKHSSFFIVTAAMAASSANATILTQNLSSLSSEFESSKTSSWSSLGLLDENSEDDYVFRVGAIRIPPWRSREDGDLQRRRRIAEQLQPHPTDPTLPAQNADSLGHFIILFLFRLNVDRRHRIAIGASCVCHGYPSG